VAPDQVLISNKLAWKRVPLTTPEPTFEPGAWVNLKHDASQDISYQGMYDCYEQGNELLGKYKAQIISVHDPDEYLAAATDDADLEKRRQDVLGAYKALSELKAQGKAQSIGVGAKDISSIGWISDHIQLDWAMFACSITPYAHSDYAKGLLKKLGGQGVDVINSAVFNAGFLIGGSHFDYRAVTRESDPELFEWRDKFNAVCEEFNVKPPEACVQFSFLFPEIKSIALNTSKPSRVQSNVDLVNAVIPEGFWDKMKSEGLINI
jgi:D-threo-aldose 1-dehydrogenase